MKILTLTENTTSDPRLLCEHGLSLYIETGDRKILFDSGQSDAFAQNAKKLGVDLSQVDFAVLSHGHYDHGGGLTHFLELNDHAPVYLSTHAFGGHYNASDKYIGLNPVLAESNRLHFVQEELFLDESIRIYPNLGEFLPNPIDPCGLQMMKNGALTAEDFRHEIYLQITENDKQFLFSGCSHMGIENIVQHFSPNYFFGGFHLSKVSDGKRLQHTAEILHESGAVCYTGHCTGAHQFSILKTVLKEQLFYLSTGTQVVI